MKSVNDKSNHTNKIKENNIDQSKYKGKLVYVLYIIAMTFLTLPIALNYQKIFGFLMLFVITGMATGLVNNLGKILIIFISLYPITNIITWVLIIKKRLIFLLLPILHIIISVLLLILIFISNL